MASSPSPDTSAIEDKWQTYWQDNDLFAWTEDRERQKYYILEMFPYTSGRMHMGHARNFTMGDVIARAKRAQGLGVLYPMGWDAFGLPAENAAIKLGIHPAKSTADAIFSMKRSMIELGLSYDWNREIDTSNAEYIAAQQRLFLKFYEAGLVYRDTKFANWCEQDQTVLADEQVIDGRCWRCGSEVSKRLVPQWFFDIRKYADQLIDDLDQLEDWPESVKKIQRSWVGRSHGANVKFDVCHASGESIESFTTRVDTLMGCTFVLLAAEHKALDTIPLPADHEQEVESFRARVLSQTRQDRLENRQKEGVFTGWTVRHPLTGGELPVWVANYVLPDYGTGAVMAVPAHDQRDLEFARKYSLPYSAVISPGGEPLTVTDEAFIEDGLLINSGDFDGLTTAAAREAIAERLASIGYGGPATTYRLQNWSISRQRYWGNPIPIIFCEQHGAVPVPESDLPVLLPLDVDFMNSSRAILSSHEFVNTVCPIGGEPARRDVDTMDTFVDSSWYFLRFLAPHSIEPFPRNVADRMLPADLYIGGIEHAALHLIYSRFFVKALRDFEMLDFDEPFQSLRNQGMVNDSEGFKQSKSRGNITEPAEMIALYGADALRVYLMFATSPENAINWDDSGPRSAVSFIQRVCRLVEAAVVEQDDAKSDAASSKELLAKAHGTIVRVTSDIDDFRFNTAIAELMSLGNTLSAHMESASIEARREAVEVLIKLLNPFAPHFTEELWQKLGNETSLAASTWPQVRPELLVKDEDEIVVQINGKLIEVISVPRGLGKSDLEATALALDKVQQRLAGAVPVRTIHVPGKLVNFVA
jgi:leucyl-tRNA synthetase